MLTNRKHSIKKRRIEEKIAQVSIIILIISVSGCAIPLRMETINRTDLYEIRLQEARFEYEKQERLKEIAQQENKEKALRLERRRLVGYAWIQKLKAERLKKKELLRFPKPEKELILLAFDDSGIILKAFEKLGCSMFDIAGLLNEYSKNDIDGFCDFLAGKYPFNSCYRWELDNKIFNPVKRNYKLLKKLNDKNK